MAVKFEPSKLLKKIAPARKIEKLITRKLTVNRAALSMLSDSGVINKKILTDVTLKVVKQYKTRYGVERAQGLGITAAREEALNGNALLVQRVQNAALHEIAKEVRKQYSGEFYEWLPSDAEEPDPLHQLNYGQTFQLGKQEDPGERYGCRCGMNLLVDEETLDLGDDENADD